MAYPYDVDEKIVQIHTTISWKERHECLTNGWDYNELIRLGIKAKKGMPDLTKRVTKLEQDLTLLEKIIYSTKGIKKPTTTEDVHE